MSHRCLHCCCHLNSGDNQSENRYKYVKMPAVIFAAYVVYFVVPPRKRQYKPAQQYPKTMNPVCNVNIIPCFTHSFSRYYISFHQMHLVQLIGYHIKYSTIYNPFCPTNKILKPLIRYSMGIILCVLGYNTTFGTFG